MKKLSLKALLLSLLLLFPASALADSAPVQDQKPQISGTVKPTEPTPPPSTNGRGVWDG